MEIADIPVEVPAPTGEFSTKTIIAGSVIAGVLLWWWLKPKPKSNVTIATSTPSGQVVVTALTQAELDAKYTAEQQYGAGDKAWEQNLKTTTREKGAACTLPFEVNGKTVLSWSLPSHPEVVKQPGDVVACPDLDILVPTFAAPITYDQSRPAEMCAVADVAIDSTGTARAVDYFIGPDGAQKRPGDVWECLKANQWNPVFKTTTTDFALPQNQTWQAAQQQANDAYFGAVF